MDPITVLALSCNIIDLVGKGIKCVTKAKQIYDEASGLSKEHAALSEFTKDVEDIAVELVGKANQLQNEATKSASTANNHGLEDIASRCQGLVQRINGLLKKCKAKEPKSLRATIKTTIQVYLSKDEIEQLEKELKDGQAILQTQLQMTTRIQVDTILKSTELMRYAQREIKSQLNKVLDDLKEISHAHTFETIQRARSLSQEAEFCLDRHRTLRVLPKPGDLIHPNPRFDDLTNAAQGTFEWIFTHPEKMLEIAPKLQITFLDWLRRGNGVFHIAGKPGSGKSTFMKFLYQHLTTREALEQWAGNDELLMSSFFFWKIDPHQNGLDELKLSILHQIIGRYPVMCKLLFRDYWQMIDAPEHFPNFKLSIRDVSIAFDALLQDPDIIENRRLCFFIDGLDEFDERKGTEDHDSLVKIIQSWVVQSNGRVKICVSSREYTIFEQFSETRRIYLQDLTRDDILKYVRINLGSHGHFHSLEVPPDRNNASLCRVYTCSHELLGDCLIRTIAGRAEGVFLWVRLLVEDLRRGLNRLESAQSLWKRVERTPKRLNAYIQFILEDIEDQDKLEAFLLFAIVIVAETGTMPSCGTEARSNKNPMIIREMYWPYAMSSLACYYYFEMFNSGNYDPFQSYHSTRNTSFVDMIDMSTGWIRARCRGLLETRRNRIEEDSEKRIPHWTEVTFLHRSIVEVIQTHISSVLASLQISPLRIVAWMTRLARDEIGCLRTELNLRENHIWRFSVRVNAILSHLRMLEEDDIQFILPLLKSLGLVIESSRTTRGSWNTCFKPSKGKFDIILPERVSFPMIAAYNGLYELVLPIVREMEPLKPDGPFSRAIIWSCCHGFIHSNDRDPWASRELELLRTLFSHGCSANVREPWGHFEASDLCPFLPILDVVTDDTMSSWQLILLVVYCRYLKLRGSPRQELWQLVELFLEYGADPLITFAHGVSVTNNHSSGEFGEHKQFWIRVYRARWDGETSMIGFDLERDEELIANEGLSETGWRTITLKELVLDSHPPNGERLVELTDRNTELVEEEDALIFEAIRNLFMPDLFNGCSQEQDTDLYENEAADIDPNKVAANLWRNWLISADTRISKSVLLLALRETESSIENTN